MAFVGHNDRDRDRNRDPGHAFLVKARVVRVDEDRVVFHLRFQHRHERALRVGREVDILDALASGDSNKVIARRLGISPNTVKTHVARVYEKLGVQRRGHAVEKARSLALTPVNHPSGR